MSHPNKPQRSRAGLDDLRAVVRQVVTRELPAHLGDFVPHQEHGAVVHRIERNAVEAFVDDIAGDQAVIHRARHFDAVLDVSPDLVAADLPAHLREVAFVADVEHAHRPDGVVERVITEDHAASRRAYDAHEQHLLL